MTIPHHGKRDKNEPEIIEALTAAGASVVKLSIHNVPDLLVGYGSKKTFLLEVKYGKNKLKDGQREWIDNWQGSPVYIVRTVEEALALLA